MSGASIAQIIKCLQHAFGHFVRPWKIIEHNPFEDVVLPTAKSKNAIFLSPDQATTLLEKARSHRYEVAILIMLSLGLRRGEVCALHWCDIDFERKPMTISGTLHVRGEAVKLLKPTLADVFYRC